MPFRLQIPRTLYDRMLFQAAAELPNECCGLLAGLVVGEDTALPEKRLGKVEQCYPLANAAASPVEYLSEPRAMFDAVRDMRRRGIDVLAVYHSHPTSDPVPSRTDLQRNYSPDVINLIISLKAALPVVRGWWLTDHDFREAQWECAEGLAEPR
jgi:proteasome lid subunit RPN8/RPN11